MYTHIQFTFKCTNYTYTHEMLGGYIQLGRIKAFLGYKTHKELCKVLLVAKCFESLGKLRHETKSSNHVYHEHELYRYKFESLAFKKL